MKYWAIETTKGKFKWFDRGVVSPQPRYGQMGHMHFLSIEEAESVIEPLVRLGNLIEVPQIIEF
jgi:hypothetical protein